MSMSDFRFVSRGGAGRKVQLVASGVHGGDGIKITYKEIVTGTHYYSALYAKTPDGLTCDVPELDYEQRKLDPPPDFSKQRFPKALLGLFEFAFPSISEWLRKEPGSGFTYLYGPPKRRLFGRARPTPRAPSYYAARTTRRERREHLIPDEVLESRQCFLLKGKSNRRRASHFARNAGVSSLRQPWARL